MPESIDTRASLLDAVLASTQEAEARRTLRIDAFLRAHSPWHALVLWLDLQPGDAVPDRRRLAARLVLDIAELDKRLCAQVNAILHAPEFQRLEAAWRGTDYLVAQAAQAEGVVVRMLDASWRVLARDLERAIEFDQSVLFRKVYSDEFGSPGGQPFGILIGDYQISHRPRPDQQVDDTRALRSISQVAAAAFAPFVAGVHPTLFGIDSLRRLSRRIDLQRSFAQAEYTTWNSMRDLADARFLALTMPRVLMREPWRPTPSRADGFRFEEDVCDATGDGYLWGNASFAFGGVVIRAYERSGWFGDIRGVVEGELGGGLVSDLPVLDFGSQAPGGSARPSTDVVVTDVLERQLSELGLIALCACQGLPYSVFYATPSLQRPERFTEPEAAANARLSAMLQYILCTSRIAHYLKMMFRDRTGSYSSAAEIEREIGEWLFRFSVSSEEADPDALARYPLADTSIAVREVPGKPGTYSSVVHLRPHFQLDQMSSTIRLMTEFVTSK